MKIGKGAKVRNCVIMQDTVIGANSRLDYVVADKNVEIEENRHADGLSDLPGVHCKGKQGLSCPENTKERKAV